LVFQFDTNAREHTVLYQRFKALQAKILGGRAEWRKHLDEWQAEAQSIRIDEPPTYWALYNLARNQVLEKYGVAQGNARKVSPWQRIAGLFKRYRPEDFAPA